MAASRSAYRRRTLVLAILLVAFVELLCAGRDFYKILGVQRGATTNEIKKAYRRMAKEMHPDVNRDDPKANDKFQDLAAAYEVLSDGDKRKIYDKSGEEGLKDSHRGGGADVFSQFFGNGFFGQQQERQASRGADVKMPLEVTLEELYNGEFVEIVRYKPVKDNAPGTRKCRCRQEQITKQIGPNNFQIMQQVVCDECPNFRYRTEERLLEVEIEPGMLEGQEQTFAGEGEPHADGDSGDLKVRIHTLPHRVFERRGDDLYTNISIGLQQALIGFSMNIRHLDGRAVKIHRDSMTRHGQKIVLPEGMPKYANPEQKGKLVITVEVLFPRQRDFQEEDKELLRKLLEQDDVRGIAYNGLRRKLRR